MNSIEYLDVSTKTQLTSTFKEKFKLDIAKSKLFMQIILATKRNGKSFLIFVSLRKTSHLGVIQVELRNENQGKINLISND